MDVSDLEAVTVASLPLIKRGDSLRDGKRYLELHAALIVGAATSTQIRQLDSGRRGQVADFIIARSPAAVDAIGLLEVTTDTNPHVANFNARAARNSGRFKCLKWNWSLRTDAKIPPRELCLAVVSHLAQLEAQGFVDEIVSAGVPLDAPGAGPPLPSELIGLGVTQAHAFCLAANSQEGGRISLYHLAAPSGFYSVVEGVRLLGERIQTEARKRDNQLKLSAITTDRAELFIWLDVSYISLALRSIRSALEAALDGAVVPFLPAPVTAVWVSVPNFSYSEPVEVLIHLSANGWSLISSPELGV